MGKPGMTLRSDGHEKSEVKVESVETDTCDDTMKPRRGRPPKVPRIDEVVKKPVGVKIEENDDAVELVNAGKKGKRGRPPKLQRSVGSYEKADCIEIEENGHPGELENDGKIPKRGRPPILQQTFGSQADNVKIKESVHCGELVNDGKKPKRGRPPILQQSSGSHRKTDSVEIRVDGHSVKLENDGKKPKRGRPPALRKTIGSHKEDDNVKIGESCHSGELGNDGKKPKRGRPPILQKSSGYDKKSHSVKNGETGHSGSLGNDGKKPKRGRPKKVQIDNGVQKKATTLQAGENDHSKWLGRKRKRGRKPKSTASHSVNDKVRKLITGKRGRPPKVNGSDGSYNDDKKENVGLLVDHKGLLSMDGPEKFLPRKEPHEFEPAKSMKSSNEKKSKNEACMAVVRRKPKYADEQKRSDMKRALRDRIVELLLAAGWTIEYRPRNGREYNDAVYVNPEGNTHWSVTLAYRKLKSECVEGKGNSNSNQSGFIFTPIPEEELSILTRVVTKTRKGKKKSKAQDKDADTDTEEKWKKKTKKKKLQKNKSNEIPMPGRKHKLQDAQKRKRSSLMVRKAIGAESNGDGYVMFDGKRSLLSWMIDLDTLPLDGKVQYVNRRMSLVLRQGKITKDGIQCDCCGEIYTFCDFETHTGSELNQPFQNICLETGKSLLQCLFDSWNKQEDRKLEGFHFVETCADDRNDDTCGICGDGGDLICCDSCPSTFHQTCLGIKKFPSGDWHCIYCMCKFCGKVGDYTCQRRAYEDATQSAWISCCSLCEENYHQSCAQMEAAASYTPGSPTFCGKKCQELFERVKILVGVQNGLPEGFSWTLARRFGNCSYTSLGEEASQEVVCNSKLAVALSVMDECFRPLVDHRSGTNLINNIVYNFGSNFKRLDYSGFLTAILEKGDEIIAAASIRIHGNQFAEMPFIGTRYSYRRQGMCRRLLNAIESALSYLNVENLIIPAVSELKDTWTSVFGFKPLDKSSKQKLRSMNMLVFPGVDMLQKKVLKDRHVQEKTLPPKGLDSYENMKCKGVDEVFAKSHENGPALFDLNMPDDGMTGDVDNDIDGAVVADPGDSLNNTSGVLGGIISQSETATFVCSDLPDTNESSVALVHGFDAAVQMSGNAEGNEEHNPQKPHALELGSHVDKSMADPLRIGNNLGPPVA